MRTVIARSVATVGVLGAVIALAGCGILEPTRDADGRVVKTMQLASTDLLLGDCFSFIDGTDHSLSMVTPCAEAHTYIVIAQGTLPEQAITDAGSLQNAVSAACTDTFSAFVEKAGEGTDPQQEFIVYTPDGAQQPSYSCLATDSAVVAAG